jgi:hypothetical protein
MRAWADEDRSVVNIGTMVLDTLRGEWALRRNVHPTGDQLIGDAAFAPAGESALAYQESGILRLRDGRELSASRQYRYCAVGKRVAVQFADGPNTGNMFLNLEFSRKNWGFEATGTHFCGDDAYQAYYRILDAGSFETVIRVVGPRKAYELTSRYSRALRTTQDRLPSPMA